MSLNNEFTELISMELEKKNKNVAMLYDYLVEFKQKGMDQKSMLMNLERLRYQNDSDMEDVVLDLMDYVVGFCSPGLSIF